MSQKKKIKICLIVNSLAKGGAEKVSAVLSNLFDAQGYEVFNVVFIDDVEYPYKGTLLNLGKIKNEKNDFFNKLKRLRALYDFVKTNQFDYIIDNRYLEHQFQEFFLTKFVYSNAQYIRVVHSYKLTTYFPKNQFLAKNIYKNCRIVGVSEAITENIKQSLGYSDVTTIYNPIDIDKIREKSQEFVPFDFPYIIGLGRMAKDNVKQQDVMIKAYAQSRLKEKGIKLVLVGDGPRRREFESLTKELQLVKDVIFTGFQTNPFAYLKNALFTLLTSKHEGFPNAITESMACETPVVSYNCKSGPDEVIVGKFNGLLVEDQNLEKLVEAINTIAENQELYQKCKSNTLATAERYSLNQITSDWIRYLH